MSRRILQGVIGSNSGRPSNSPTRRGSSSGVPATAAPIRGFETFRTFSQDLVETDLTELFFAGPSLGSAPASTHEDLSHRTTGSGSELNTSHCGVKRTLTAGPSVLKSAESAGHGKSKRPRKETSARGESARAREYCDWSLLRRLASGVVGGGAAPRIAVPPRGVPLPARALGGARLCARCGGVFYCACAETEAPSHDLSALLLWVTGPWAWPYVSKILHSAENGCSWLLVSVNTSTDSFAVRVCARVLACAFNHGKILSKCSKLRDPPQQGLTL